MNLDHPAASSHPFGRWTKDAPLVYENKQLLCECCKVWLFWQLQDNPSEFQLYYETIKHMTEATEDGAGGDQRTAALQMLPHRLDPFGTNPPASQLVETRNLIFK